MEISVVIPTCDRKSRLLSLLRNLNDSSHPINEVIIVDSGEDRLVPSDYSTFLNLRINYLKSEKSVCTQRNIGIRNAGSPWIFLCDDDLELPGDFLQKLASHANKHPNVAAVSGLWLQQVQKKWQATFPENSSFQLFWKFIFQLGIWGEINCSADNIVMRRIKQYYKTKGNHISKAGWPVITDFSGDYFTTPVYSLGASLIKKEWLVVSPYDEVLDRHGLGDNYGVAMGLPAPGIHVLNSALAYHHQEATNRLQKPLQYYRRTLALHYFIKTKKNLKRTKTRWLIWSLAGNLSIFLFSENKIMVRAALKSIWIIATGQNPYYKAAKRKQKVIEPGL